MNKFLTIALLLSSMALSACGATKEKTNMNNPESKNTILVAYFSATGNTKALAEKIADVTSGYLFEIVPEQPYTEADLDGWNDSARGTLEARDRTTRPRIKSKVDNMAQYDTIYLGFPIWWYTAPTIVNTFLEQYDTEGKIIIPFATSGGSPIGKTEKDLVVSAPKATFLPGRVLNNATTEQVSEWIKTITNK